MVTIKKKTQKITSVSEDMEKSESLVPCCGNVKWCNCYGKQDGGFSKKLKNRALPTPPMSPGANL